MAMFDFEWHLFVVKDDNEKCTVVKVKQYFEFLNDSEQDILIIIGQTFLSLIIHYSRLSPNLVIRCPKEIRCSWTKLGVPNIAKK